MENPFERYLFALLEALRHPTDRKADMHARTLERTHTETLAWHIGSDTVLGPSPEEFSSDEEWVSYKRGLRAFFDDSAQVKDLDLFLSTLRNPSSSTSQEWCALLFHPDDWGQLEAYGLIKTSNLARIRKTKVAELMAIPKNFIGFAQFESSDFEIPSGIFDLPLIKIIRCAMTIHDAGRLRESDLVLEVLARARTSEITANEANELLRSIPNVDRLPNHWAQLLVAMGLLTPGIDLRLLSDVWKKLNQTVRHHFWLIPVFFQPAPETLRRVIKDLVALGERSSLSLAAALIRHNREFGDELSMAINGRIASILIEEADLAEDKSELVHTLFASSPTIAEAKLYTNARWFLSTALANPYFSNAVANRITMMPRTIALSDFAELSAYLEVLVDRCKGYPVGVSVAAMGALIQINVASKPPLNEKMWQVDGGGATAV